MDINYTDPILKSLFFVGPPPFLFTFMSLSFPYTVVSWYRKSSESPAPGSNNDHNDNNDNHNSNNNNSNDKKLKQKTRN